MRSVWQTLIPAAFAAAASAAHAVPVTYDFAGVLTHLQSDVDSRLPGVQLGDTFSVRLVIDSAAAAVPLGAPDTAFYGDVNEFINGAGPGFTSTIAATLTAHGTTVPFQFGADRNTGPAMLVVLDGAATQGAVYEGLQFSTVAADNSAAELAYVSFLNVAPQGTDLAGAAGVLSGTALPGSLAGIGGATADASFGYFFGPRSATNGISYIGGQITSASVSVGAAPVPEPTSAALMLLGVAAFVALRTNKRG